MSHPAEQADDPWARWNPDGVRGKGKGKGNKGGKSSSPVDMSASDVRTKIEIKGYIQDWKVWQDQAMSRDEARSWIERVVRYLPEEFKQNIDVKTSIALNNKPHVPILNLQTTGGRLYETKEAISRELHREDLKVNGVETKATVEAFEWQKPIRKAVAVGCGTIARTLDIPEKQLTSNYSTKNLTIFTCLQEVSTWPNGITFRTTASIARADVPRQLPCVRGGRLALRPSTARLALHGLVLTTF